MSRLLTLNALMYDTPPPLCLSFRSEGSAHVQRCLSFFEKKVLRNLVQRAWSRMMATHSVTLREALIITYSFRTRFFRYTDRQMSSLTLRSPRRRRRERETREDGEGGREEDGSGGGEV